MTWKRTLVTNLARWIECIEEHHVDNTSQDILATIQQLALGGPFPGINPIKDFFRYYVATSKGVLEDRITVKTFCTTAEWFFAGFERVTGNVVTKEDRPEVHNWASTLYPEGKFSRKEKHKSLFGEQKALRFLHTFWNADDARFIHPRNKLQIPFVMSVFQWTGGRIGALFPGRGKKDHPVQRAQHITQPDQRTYGRDYIASTSSVDGRSAFYNEPAQHDHVNYFQSFAPCHEPGLPTTVPAEYKLAPQQHPEYLSLRDTINRLKKADAIATDIKALRVRCYRQLEKARKNALKEYKSSWVEQQRREKMICQGVVDPRKIESTGLEETLSIIMPERR
ncbi:MAG: hypothetical protein Q9166_002472 [cf. Caloplaca sp. 2 TL-2023]